ncbi:phosphotransferase [Oligoflexia bacterium]|nr:phosphotransferase [Oligoflexia bacterium]
MSAADDLYPVEERLQELARRLLATTPDFTTATIKRYQALAGDASGRRYIRLYLEDAPATTLILQVLAHGVGPVYSSSESFNQDDTYVELSLYFEREGIPVPKLYFDGREAGGLLIEDVGDLPLWQFAFDKLDEDGQKVKKELGEDATLTLYQRVVDLIVRLQGCAPDPDCVAFKRSLEFEQYRMEAARFVDHCLLPNAFPKRELQVVSDLLDRLCESVAAHKQVLAHRDCMPWNIHVGNGVIGRSGAVTLIDFQDALTASYVYDLVALVHDRNADYALGDESCVKIVNYFKAQFNLDDSFYKDYLELLLQRHFRLAGQFALLTVKTGNPIYQSWIPGCLKRVGRALAALDDTEAPLQILSSLIPDVRAGADNPFDFSP